MQHVCSYLMDYSTATHSFKITFQSTYTHLKSEKECHFTPGKETGIAFDLLYSTNPESTVSMRLNEK